MNEKQATTLARALGGDVWQSGGGNWLVIIRRENGSLDVVSD